MNSEAILHITISGLVGILFTYLGYRAMKSRQKKKTWAWVKNPPANKKLTWWDETGWFIFMIGIFFIFVTLIDIVASFTTGWEEYQEGLRRHGFPDIYY